MVIKHSVMPKLRKFGKKRPLYQIRIRATWSGWRDDYPIGYTLCSEEDFDKECGLVRGHSVGSKRTKASVINARIVRYIEVLEDCFKYFEVIRKVPDPHMLRAMVETVFNSDASTPVFHVGEPGNTQPKPKKTDLFKLYDRYVKEKTEIREWTRATVQKHDSLRNDLHNYNSHLCMEDLTEECLAGFISYLRNDKVLRTPRHKKGAKEGEDNVEKVGLYNTTIGKKYDLFKCFLKWASERGINMSMDYKFYKPKLKDSEKPIIFLTLEELQALHGLAFTKEEEHLEKCRDNFLFLCFSGLRHSDFYALRKSDIRDGKIFVTTQKTEDSLSIELNVVTQEILDKYKDVPFPNGKALPVQVNQKMNEYLKIICKRAGIDEPIRITQYRGNERIDTFVPKHELVTTHVGRKTFTTQCLAQGIPPETVMKWTGHKQYSVMRRYIGTVDSAKEREMKKMDNLKL